MKLNKILTVTATISLVAFIAMQFTGSSSSTQHAKNSDKQMASNTAMITNFKGNSGGTGVVLRSGPYVSTVLTNAHVCQVVKYGGLVSTDTKQGSVTSYKVSEVHDLCIINTNVNLGAKTEVAEEAPELYSPAVVSGHPQLLPTVITKGTFSGKEIIDIMTGMRECTKEDLENGLGILCVFLGGIPVIKTYQSQVISATIQPGSSGSAVYNTEGKIAGLVFAGAGQLSYGHIVPLEYVRNFLENELPALQAKTPLDNSLSKLQNSAESKLKSACTESTDTLTYQIVKDYCKYIGKDAIYQ